MLLLGDLGLEGNIRIEAVTHSSSTYDMMSHKVQMSYLIILFW